MKKAPIKTIERKERSDSSGAAHGSVRCEGWRRRGGAFTLGPVTWKQCEAQGIVTLKFKDDRGKVKTLPACKECWAECLATGVTIIEARPTCWYCDGTGEEE